MYIQFSKVSILLLLFLLIGCREQPTVSENQDALFNTSTEKLESDLQTITTEIDYNIKEYNMSMAGGKYFLQIIPDTNRPAEQAMYSVLLVKNRDTIINYLINIDTIHSHYQDLNSPWLNEENKDLKNNYYLTGIEKYGVRADILIFEAALYSKKDTLRKKVQLKFRYRGNKTGKLYMGTFDKIK